MEDYAEVEAMMPNGGVLRRWRAGCMRAHDIRAQQHQQAGNADDTMLSPSSRDPATVIRPCW